MKQKSLDEIQIQIKISPKLLEGTQHRTWGLLGWRTLNKERYMDPDLFLDKYDNTL